MTGQDDYNAWTGPAWEMPSSLPVLASALARHFGLPEECVHLDAGFRGRDFKFESWEYIGELIRVADLLDHASLYRGEIVFADCAGCRGAGQVHICAHEGCPHDQARRVIRGFDGHLAIIRSVLRMVGREFPGSKP